MTREVVYIDGRLVEAAAARIQPTDAGFERGDGVFETLRVVGGRPCGLTEHLARMFAGLARLRIAVPESAERLADAATTVAASGTATDARLRITVSAGASGIPTRVIQQRPWVPPTGEQYRVGVAVVSAGALRIHTANPLSGIKSISYGGHAWLAREVARDGHYEGLVVNERDELVEATRCNIVVEIAGRLITPPLASGCLPGTVRARLLGVGSVVEATVPVDDADAVTGMALSNSLVGVLPVATLDGRPLRISPAIEALVAAGSQAVTP